MNKLSEWRKDERSRFYIDPTRVIWTSEGPGSPLNPQTLIQKHSGQSAAGGAAPCTLKTPNNASSGLLLDFGRELHGGVRITTLATANRRPIRIRIRLGESASEAMSEISPDTLPGQSHDNDHAIRDAVLTIPNYGSLEFGNSGFRFVRLDLIEPDSHFELKSIHAILLIRDLERQGHFRCSDPLINRIWDVAADTVQLNMQDYIWDGIKRDRLVWLGDMHPETRVVSALFGEHAIIPKSLDFIRDRTPLPGWMNGISTYSAWWVLIQHHWFTYHANRAYLAEQKAYLKDLLNILLDCVDPNGWQALPGRAFLDWPTNADDTSRLAGLQAVMKLTVQAGAELCSELGMDELSRACRETSARMQAPSINLDTNKQAAALISLAGLVDPQTINREILAQGGAKGLSSFLGYYTLQARSLAGDSAGALQNIRDYWGGMLKMGATSFWEDFDIDWMENSCGIDELPVPGMRDIHADFGRFCYQGLRHSLCHGWAGGPSAWSQQWILGVQPTAPGFSEVHIQPALGDLDWAEGCVPSPHGLIHVKAERKNDGSIQEYVDLPAGVRRTSRKVNHITGL